MTIVGAPGFNRLVIKENADVECLKLIGIEELIEKFQTNTNEPLLNGDGIEIEKWHCLGSFVAISKGVFSILIGRNDNSYIYRGQNINHSKLIPTALRDEQKDVITNCISWVHKQEFLDFFKTTPYYKRCKTFQVFDCVYDFDLEAVAQHYGFISNYIDVTKAMYIAMFFAYTQYDIEKDEYFPIQDFKNYSPVLYIGNLKNIYKDYNKAFKIVGFQSVLRPRLQHAMALDATVPGLKSKFEIIELPKSPAMALEIYNQFRNGETIFPKDYISFIAKTIRNSEKLNKNYVQEYCSLNKIEYESLSEQLQNKGFKLTDIKYMANSFDEYMMNRDLDDWILPTINQYIAVFCSKKCNYDLHFKRN